MSLLAVAAELALASLCAPIYAHAVATASASVALFAVWQRA